MGKTGFEPAVVETSPNNFQVWLNHGRVLSDRLLSTLVGAPARLAVWREPRELRLAAFWATSGFTNQKKERQLTERTPAVRQAAQQRRVRLLRGERVSSRGGSAETRAAFAA
jgi:hypothetical protein